MCVSLSVYLKSIKITDKNDTKEATVKLQTKQTHFRRIAQRWFSRKKDKNNTGVQEKTADVDISRATIGESIYSSPEERKHWWI